jgi:hypothetical protein
MRFIMLSIITLSIIMLSIVFYLASCNNSKIIEGAFAVRPANIHGMNADKLMPPEATAIKYKIHDTGFGYGISWKCNVAQNDFINFAKRKNWKLLKKEPDNRNISFAFYGSWKMPEDYYYYFSPTASSSGLWIMYDKAKETLYGQYSDR